ncbi:MAG: hypothetical protein J6386_02240 [Candidatus Synoicihabitans palmerolidicus]|nr:hypothetical protein [Candidatus Synoicihabitans palmerolidicus]
MQVRAVEEEAQIVELLVGFISDAEEGVRRYRVRGSVAEGMIILTTLAGLWQRRERVCNVLRYKLGGVLLVLGGGVDDAVGEFSGGGDGAMVLAAAAGDGGGMGVGGSAGGDVGRVVLGSGGGGPSGIGADVARG